MKRIKLAYNDSEIRTDLYTYGAEFATDDNVEYVGLYHEYIITGERYTGATWNETTSRNLKKLQDASDANYMYRKIKQQKLQFDAPIPDQVSLTIAQRNAGQFTRYFLKNVVTGALIEISESEHVKYQTKKLDNNLYELFTTQWQLKQQNVAQNETAIRELTRRDAKFGNILTSTQFIESDNIVIPKDINIG